MFFTEVMLSLRLSLNILCSFELYSIKYKRCCLTFTIRYLKPKFAVILLALILYESLYPSFREFFYLVVATDQRRKQLKFFQLQS